MDDERIQMNREVIEQFGASQQRQNGRFVVVSVFNHCQRGRRRPGSAVPFAARVASADQLNK